MTHFTSLQRSSLRVVPRPTGLTDIDLRRARTSLARLLPDWDLDHQEDCDRSVFATISARTECEDTPVFTLHVEGATIILAMVARDQFVRLGRHDRIEAAIQAIAALIQNPCPMAA
ncbi:MAG: hypothetical protein BGO51_21645 [Rhodospirillales bacterium 69-11]|nr:hypothetical protein [Rhodospirillales bacterium]MBN8927577.1 hypothetical protein [Rhodospirillales bacterium]OJW27498.1 MAG: hypothetical protein BGO51_21645 [Rhodospirillales bacterium 69-11]